MNEDEKTALQKEIESAQGDIFSPERPWYEGPLAVFDVETTGRDPATARIIQAAFAIVSPEGELLPGSYKSYLELPPGVEMAPDAIEAHGITPEILASEGDTPEFVLADIYDRFRYTAMTGMPLLIYNTPYDWPLVKAEWRRYDFVRMPGWRGLPSPSFLDPLLLDRHFNKYRKGGRKLGTLAEVYGVPLENAHDAFEDCLATAGVARAIVARFPEIRGMTLRKLQSWQADAFDVWKRDMNSYFRRKGNPTVITESWPE